MISNSSPVESYFGYWPNFADGKIELFAFEKIGSIKLKIFYIDAHLHKQATVSLLFQGVSDVQFSELLSENVVDELQIGVGSPIQVVLESSYGLCGSFVCCSVTVAELVV